MSDIEAFATDRPRLFAIAYRMLGSASEAEDVVQDAWMRLSDVDESTVRSPQAFATTIVTRLCLDRLKSARARREEYVGPWLPEPLLTNENEMPDVLAERAESVTLAFLLLLDELSAEERAVFLLKEVFDHEHGEIADILGTSSANSRQLLHRAKTKVRDLKASDAAEKASSRATAERFAEAFLSGNQAALTELLAADVRFVSDGGGKVAAARRPLSGRDDVVKFLVGLNRAAHATGQAAYVSLELADVNAQPAVIVRLQGEVDGVFVLSVDRETVTDIQVVRNPDKLAFLKRQLAP